MEMSISVYNMLKKSRCVYNKRERREIKSKENGERESEYPSL